MKKSIVELKAEISAIELDTSKKIAELKKQIEFIQTECPHPSSLLDTKVSSQEDEYGRYENSMMTVKCILCEKVRYSDYFHTGKDPHPTPDGVIRKK